MGKMPPRHWVVYLDSKAIVSLNVLVTYHKPRWISTGSCMSASHSPRLIKKEEEATCCQNWWQPNWGCGQLDGYKKIYTKPNIVSTPPCRQNTVINAAASVVNTAAFDLTIADSPKKLTIPATVSSPDFLCFMRYAIIHLTLVLTYCIVPFFR